jgi:hypothetical protein
LAWKAEKLKKKFQMSENHEVGPAADECGLTRIEKTDIDVANYPRKSAFICGSPDCFVPPGVVQPNLHRENLKPKPETWSWSVCVVLQDYNSVQNRER